MQKYGFHEQAARVYPNDNFEKYGIFWQRPVNLQHKTGNGIVFLVDMGFQYNLSESWIWS